MRMRFTIGALLLLSACSTVKPRPNQFVVEKRWVRDTLTQEYLGGRRIHRFTPILTEKLVIVANSIDGLTAYDRKSAHKRWHLRIKDGVEAGAQLIDNVLYFGAGDGLLYALNPETGQPLWTYPLKAEGIAKPLVKNGVVYVLGGNNVVHALNARTGKLIWTYNRREAGNISVRGGSQPALSGNLLLVGFSDGALVACNKSSGAVVWEVNLNRNKRFRDVDATPVVDGDIIYISSYDGALYALHRDDGRILWSVDEGGYDEVLLQGSTLYFSSTGGKTMAIDKKTGKTLWSQNNPAGIATGPVLYKGVLMVGEMEGALRFIDARTGELIKQFEPGRGVTSRAAVDPETGEVYFISTDAILYALQVNWKRYAKEWPWE